jgi:hypothetical protein
MKILNKLFIALFAIFSMASCSNDFFDVNESQNSPVSSTPKLSLPVAQKYTVDLLNGGYNAYNTVGNLWSYSWAAGGDYIYFTDETKYLITSGFRTATFNSTYLLPLNNYDVIEKNTDPQYANYVAIAKIMKAFHFQYLVDAYGDVPYSEAFQRQGNTTPKYDDAQEIYNDLLVQLTAAQTLIAASASDATVLTPSSDKMLNGNMAMWAKFANTIKLRILLRQSQIGVTDYSSVNNGIGFLGAGETVYCNPGYINETNKQNPFYASFGKTAAGDAASNSNATRATDYAISKLNGDPRKQRLFAAVGTTTNYVGIAQNQPAGLSSANLSGVGPGLLSSSSQSAIIMQGAESLLLQAEAVARGFITGDANALYNDAVQASFNELGAGAAASYLGTNGYPNGTLAQNVGAIIYQKWVALMGTNGFEVWIENRRTGYPDIPVAPNATSTVLPVRLLYPSTEYGTNPNNVPLQTSGDAFTSKVFWDN